MKARYATVIFDADSTLAALEGIDWLGALRGPDVGAAITRLTERAMAGEITLQSVYAARLDTIRPSRAELAELGLAYVAAIEPGAVATCQRLREAGVRLAIVSGGLRDALLPLAHELGIPADDVHAVSITFDSDGRYAGLPGDQPLRRQFGKPHLVSQLNLPRPSVMVGDGATDAEVSGVTDAFIAYTRVARRPLVVSAADAEATDFAALDLLLFDA